MTGFQSKKAMANDKILTRDEFTASVAQLIISNFGSVEAFAEAWNETLEKSDQVAADLGFDPSERSYMDVVDNALALTEDYMEDCQYRNVNMLTAEDLDYLATELQISTEDLEIILHNYMGRADVKE